MNYQIQIALHLNENLGLKSATFMHNDTPLTSNSMLLEEIAWTIIKACHLNKDNLKVDDMLSELNIIKSNENY